MDLQEVPKMAIVLLLTGIFFALAMVIMGSFQTQTYSLGNDATAEAFVVPLSDATANGTVTLAHYPITTFTSITNGTVTLAAANYSVALSTGVLTITYVNNASALCGNGTTCYATYVYTETTTAASTSVDNTITALGEIPNNWLVLIMVVVAASIIIGIVINNLGGRGGRE